MVTMPDEDLEELVRFTHHLADISTGIALKFFRRPIEVENKGESSAFDPVTEADRGIERAVRNAINARWPHHGIEGEEFATQAGDGPYRWTIDPIDGTRAFVAGFPTWGTLIGLSRASRPMIGMMSQPFTGERFWATPTSTHYRGPGGEMQVSTRRCPSLEQATFSTTAPELFADGFETTGLAKITARARITRYGGDCYAYCLLAAGHLDLVVETSLKPFDIAPLVPIVESAGGRITSWQGGDASNGGRVVAAGDPALHKLVLEILRG